MVTCSKVGSDLLQESQLLLEILNTASGVATSSLGQESSSTIPRQPSSKALQPISTRYSICVAIAVLAGIALVKVLMNVDDELLLRAIVVLDSENARSCLSVADTILANVRLCLGEALTRKKDIL